MHRLITLAAVVVLAVSCVNCANSGSDTSLTSPSVVASAASDGTGLTVGSEAKGGGKPGGGTTGGGSLTLVMVTDLYGNNNLPNWGDTVRFNVSTTATTEPNVSVSCTQNGVLVYSAGTGYYPSYPWPSTQNMTLSSGSWQSGGASCTAKLSYINGTSSIYLTSISFNVGA